MAFEDLLSQLRNPGEDGLPESIYDDLAGEYSLAVEGGAFRAAELQSQLEASGAEVARLKAMNFDLLTANAGPAVVEEPGAAEAAADAVDEDDEDNGDGGVDALFGKDDE